MEMVSVMTQENEVTECRNVVCMRGIVKHFPGVLANDNVDFDLREGEVHACWAKMAQAKAH